MTETSAVPLGFARSATSRSARRGLAQRGRRCGLVKRCCWTWKARAARARCGGLWLACSLSRARAAVWAVCVGCAGSAGASVALTFVVVVVALAVGCCATTGRRSDKRCDDGRLRHRRGGLSPLAALSSRLCCRRLCCCGLCRLSGNLAWFARAIHNGAGRLWWRWRL